MRRGHSRLLSTRAKALFKLSQHYADVDTSEQHDPEQNSLDVLLRLLPISYSSDTSKLYTIPLTLNEWEILFAVCQLVPKTSEIAKELLNNIISAYFLASPRQRVSDVLYAKFKLNHWKNPNEVLTYYCTRFLITAASKFPELNALCIDLVKTFFANVRKLYLVKQSALFSLLGLMNSFITDSSTLELTRYVWSELAQLFGQENFSKQINEMLIGPTSYTNEAIVQYFDNGREICGSLFVSTFAEVQTSLISHLISIPQDPDTDQTTRLSEYLLTQQHMNFKAEQMFRQASSDDSSSETTLDAGSQILDVINSHRSFFTEACKLSVAMCSKPESNVDLSSHDRAMFHFNGIASFFETLCLIPFMEDEEPELFSSFVKLVGHAIDKYLLTDVISDKLPSAVVAAASILNFHTEQLSEQLLRAFPLLVGSEYMTESSVVKLSKIFTVGLQALNEDSIVSTIYSINNLLTLSEDSSPKKAIRDRQLTMTSMPSKGISSDIRSASMKGIGKKLSRNSMKSALENDVNTPGYTLQKALLTNCVTTTTTIASEYSNPTITALTVSILTQKASVLPSNLNGIIITALAKLAVDTETTEFTSILKFLLLVYNTAVKKNDSKLVQSVASAKAIISKDLLSKKYCSEIYYIHLNDILDTLIDSGEVEKLEHHRSHQEISRVADQMAFHLLSLAALLPKPGEKPFDLSTNETLTNKFRNVWFNMVVHGFFYGSDTVSANLTSLLTLAYNSPPLASGFPTNNKEMSLEMNTVLRRGSSTSNMKQQRNLVSVYLNAIALKAKTVSSSKVLFLAATLLLETIRCEAGVCSKILKYLSDPVIISSNIDKSIILISQTLIKKYVHLAQLGSSRLFNSKTIAAQLTAIPVCLVDKNVYLQEAAFLYCHQFIKHIPSALCHHESLYTLLDLMSTTFDSILDCEVNKFNPRFEFALEHSPAKVLFPASKEWRIATHKKLNQAAREWVRYLLSRANQDIKILLQSYISDFSQFKRVNSVKFGVSFAVDIAGSISSADRELSNAQYAFPKKIDTVSGFISQHSWRSKYLVDTAIASSTADIATKVVINAADIRLKLLTKRKVYENDITNFLDMSVSLLVLGNSDAASLIYDIVHIPFEVFTSFSLKVAINVWLTIVKDRSDLAHVLLAEVCYCWICSIDEKKGLYSKSNELISEECQMMEYSPYDKKDIDRNAKAASKAMQPHRHLIDFFSSHFEGSSLQSDFLLKIFTTTLLYAMENLDAASLHPFARMIRFELLILGVNVMSENVKQKTKHVGKLCRSIINGGLSWFMKPKSWPFGSNLLKIRADISILQEFFGLLSKHVTIFKEYCRPEFVLLEFFLTSEIYIIATWLEPLDNIENPNSNKLTELVVVTAFQKDAQLAANIVSRYPVSKLEQFLTSLVCKYPLNCVMVPEFVERFLGGTKAKKNELYPIMYWSSATPLKAINLFLPKWETNFFVLQYSVYAVESYDVNVIFFYVPQIVQCLRYDRTGYVEKLIIDTAKISVLFAHQIIWNLLANCYKDDEGVIEDEIKPTLDRVRNRMVSTFSKAHRDFYEREFGFFNEVTGISGKLKPYIKKSKAEKKQKIDEEMSKIVVEPGVYLPSNPDGVVIGINRTSGKPLQSHAKAPFMATFKIKKKCKDAITGEPVDIEKWQSAIFKVGDDCRQDVLALQLISLFRTIWSTIGLDVYVFPYRVTATAPGCGVIDVLPNSISRDMLGREAVNGLYEYFTSKFGPESSIEYQNARNNFVKSLAGYSVISYLLQFKDRHNGNIMYDDQGHCLHIDFGFIFDIVPGGVKFEAVPFKLTREMVKVMGGSSETAAFADFEELCIKSYLAARAHMDFIIECITPMLDSGLPCFKGTKTIKNLKNRFQPGKTDHEAALYMKGLIRKSFESLFTVGYDEFQRLTNGIPY
ncbi:1-phosphatidylinositol 4-kinase STT4 KNAG_0I02930 [Huiozyma naganishii CBS 8797]|uniref:1-phosphatidylinositol 4-kinase n=1 Tax=Huiozyma naganishii (strain ATCC MYA-139 / BCRC 22969 / CBS 8797 / KCTC 17520 / NBRC 10181 / NCYC 3082 / Yp74L-3) TaxID=1071383 RepID=J7S2K4_HUIN7|nr:hypothetical protein KNAG_0I02930 [Kazachstania naganishii CBS 8797]CCK72077.1 hypothetical protein KNAG_0I02930 [Kazachstania naganishii CBS 8797]